METKQLTCTAEPAMHVVPISFPQRVSSPNDTDAIASLDGWLANAEETHRQNADAIAHNKRQVEAISEFLEGLGVLGEVVHKNWKGRLSQVETKPPGYVEDLRRAYTTSDHFDMALGEYRQILQELEKFGQ
jgi:hypothetical protein